MSIANRVSRRYGLCRPKRKHCLHLRLSFGVESFYFAQAASHGLPTNWTAAIDPVR
jgi:hypothetical protein